MTEIVREKETNHAAAEARELRHRLIYIKQRLTEIQAERASLRDELQRIKESKG